MSYPLDKNYFLLYQIWGTCLKYLPKECPCTGMHSAFHIVQWFFLCEDHKKSDDFFPFKYFHESKQTITYATLEVIASNVLAWLQCRDCNNWFQFSIFIVLIPTTCGACTNLSLLPAVTWREEPQNMAIGDLAFYYALYLWL